MRRNRRSIANLSTVRSAVELYRVQHNSMYPSKATAGRRALRLTCTGDDSVHGKIDTTDSVRRTADQVTRMPPAASLQPGRHGLHLRSLPAHHAGRTDQQQALHVDVVTAADAAEPAAATGRLALQQRDRHVPDQQQCRRPRDGTTCCPRTNSSRPCHDWCASSWHSANRHDTGRDGRRRGHPGGSGRDRHPQGRPAGPAFAPMRWPPKSPAPSASPSAKRSAPATYQQVSVDPATQVLRVYQPIHRPASPPPIPSINVPTRSALPEMPCRVRPSSAPSSSTTVDPPTNFISFGPDGAPAYVDPNKADPVV